MSAKQEIIIPLEEYNRLLQYQQELLALEAAGVDNWEGYSLAMQSLEE